MNFQMKAVVLALSAASGATFTAQAETPLPRPTETLYACAAEPDDALRLACFDKAVADLKGAENAGKVKTVDVASIEKIERESFGFALPSLTEIFRRDEAGGKTDSPEVDEVVLPIASISVSRVTKKATITLENGQIWEQVDSEELPRSKVRKGKEATIRKATMGSFLMVINDSGASIRVRRIS